MVHHPKGKKLGGSHETLRKNTNVCSKKATEVRDYGSIRWNLIFLVFADVVVLMYNFLCTLKLGLKVFYALSEY